MPGRVVTRRASQSSASMTISDNPVSGNRMPADPRVFRGLVAILLIGGILFPLTGLSLIVMLALDWLARRVTTRPRMA